MTDKWLVFHISWWYTDISAWLRSGCPLVFHGGQKIFAHKEKFQSYFFKDTPFPVLNIKFSGTTPRQHNSQHKKKNSSSKLKDYLHFRPDKNSTWRWILSSRLANISGPLRNNQLDTAQQEQNDFHFNHFWKEIKLTMRPVKFVVKLSSSSKCKWVTSSVNKQQKTSPRAGNEPETSHVIKQLYSWKLIAWVEKMKSWATAVTNQQKDCQRKKINLVQTNHWATRENQLNVADGQLL